MVFDLRQLIEDLGVMFAERAHRAEVDFVCVFPPNAHAIYRGDPDRLRQVLTNLIGNALKFTQRGEVGIKVIAAPGDGGQTKLRFEVRDTGYRHQTRTPGLHLRIVLPRPTVQRPDSLVAPASGSRSRVS